MNIINGEKIASEIAEELKLEIQEAKEDGKSFGLGVILVGENKVSKVYVDKKREKSLELGIGFYLFNIKEPDEGKITDQIEKWNKDEKITGIIAQLPLPEGLNEDKIIDYIDPSKDVDGLTSINREKLNQNIDCLCPATPLGVLELLKRRGIEIKDKKVVILGRGRLVGKPLAILLKNKGIDVEICHSQTCNTKELTLGADIIVSAVGKPKLITEDMVKEGTVVVDVGTSKEEGTLMGDVDFEKVKNKASHITPVLGGVGPLTVISLMKNVVKAKKLQNPVDFL